MLLHFRLFQGILLEAPPGLLLDVTVAVLHTVVPPFPGLGILVFVKPIGEVTIGVFGYKCNFLMGVLLGVREEGVGRARPGAAEVVPVLPLGDGLVALPASVVVLVGPAAVRARLGVLAGAVEGLPLARLPGRVRGVPVVVIPAFVPPQSVRVVLLPAPGVLAFGVVVPAPLPVGRASAAGVVAAVPAQGAVLAGAEPLAGTGVGLAPVAVLRPVALLPGPLPHGRVPLSVVVFRGLAPALPRAFSAGGTLSSVAIMSSINFSEDTDFFLNWRMIWNFLSSLIFFTFLPVTLLGAPF